MNKEHFKKYLEEPSHLHQVTYQELKSVVLQYPYCQNLRYLMAMKSKMDQHKEADKNLNVASLFSPDRTFFYHKLNSVQFKESRSENYIITEEYMELTDLSNGQSGQSDQPVEAIPRTSKEAKDWPGDDFSETDIEELEFEIPLEPATASPKEIDETQSNRVITIEPDEDMEPEKHTNESKPKVFFIEDLISDQPEPALPTEEEENNSSVEQSEQTPFMKEEQPEAETEQPTAEVVPTTEVVEPLPAEEMPSPLPTAEATPPDNIYDIPLEVTNESAISLQEEAPLSNPEPETPLKQVEEEEPALPETIESTTSEQESNDMAKTEKEMQEDSEQQPKTPPAPLPKATFSSWLKRYPSPQPKAETEKTETPKEANLPFKKKKNNKTKKKVSIDQLADSQKATPPSPKLTKKKATKSLANRSLEENAEIVSETLAEILAAQGNYEKAIAMYQRLGLIFPEKSIFFAERIQELKNS